MRFSGEIARQILPLAGDFAGLSCRPPGQRPPPDGLPCRGKP
jgi:hypothetical protein